MKKTLTAIALFAALATGAATTAEARTYTNMYPGAAPLHAGHNEGLQNYYYYFGAPCCDRPMAAPCGAVAAAPACGNPCGDCAPCMVPVEYEQVCTTCDPCGSRWSLLNPFSYFG